jgi:hypothetical protein
VQTGWTILNQIHCSWGCRLRQLWFAGLLCSTSNALSLSIPFLRCSKALTVVRLFCLSVSFPAGHCQQHLLRCYGWRQEDVRGCSPLSADT